VRKCIHVQCLLFLLFLWQHKADAQLSDYDWQSLKSITTNEGLPSNFTDALLQDSRGFLWFVTNNGTVRFDGMSFKKYEFDIHNPNSITPDWFTDMVEDKNGMLWIASANTGFYELNPFTDKIIHYRHEPGNANSLANDQVTSVEADASGTIWISSYGGLNSYNPVTHQFKLFTHKDRDTSTISHDQLWQICLDEQQNLWLATSVCFDYFNTRTGRVMHRITDTTVVNIQKASEYPIFVKKGRHHTIWMICQNTGVWGYDTREHKITRHFGYNPADSQSIHSNHIQNVFEDRYGNLWMSGEFIEVFEKSTGKIIHVSNLLHSETNLTFSNMIQDNQGKLWIVTGLEGILSIDPVQKKIKVLPDRSDKHFSKLDMGILSIHGYSKEDFIVTTDAGAYLYNLRTRSLSRFKLPYAGRELTTESFIAGSYMDNQGMLFLGTANKLITYDTATKKIALYEHSINDSTSLSEMACTGILRDRKGRYWCAVYGGGLDRFYPESGTFKAYKVHDGSNSISTNSVHGIFEDSKGLLYISATNGGLIQFNPDDGLFTVYRHKADNPSSPSNDNTGRFFETKQGFIYFTTEGGGLNVFNPVTREFRAFTTKDGLANNILYSIIEDNHGKLWLGTYSGISSFQPPGNPFDKNCKITFRNYNKSDGLPCNEIMFASVFKDPEGNLYFGSACGQIVYFNPNELKENTFCPPVYITGFSLFNKNLNPPDENGLLQTAIETTQTITLSYEQNVLAFTFAALNFVHPENNHYAYMLEGFDKDWIYTDASKRFVNYTHLDAGRYVFKVKGSNNDGIWNETPATLELIITPPYWETWWFRLAIMGIVTAGVYSLYRFRLEQILKVQNIRNKISGDLHDDIGSTLNSISIYSEVAKQKSKVQIQELDLIGESSRKVMDAMSDIVWTINPENDSFEKIIFRMRSLTHQLMKARKIEYTFDADDSLNLLNLPMQTRKNFYLIFKEALNNLVKYSQATKASIRLTSENKFVHLHIRDNGKGFDAANPPRGNGLNNMKRRAEEINAIITIESSEGKGTAVNLVLKYG